MEEAALDILSVAMGAGLGWLAGIVASVVLSVGAYLLVRRHTRLKALSTRLRVPQRVFLSLLGLGLGVTIATAPPVGSSNPPWRTYFEQGFLIVMILATALLLTGLVRAVEDIILTHGERDEETPHFRRVRTQLQVLDRVIIAVIWLCALAGALLTFPQFRAIGTSLIASAGLLSIVAGLAAQASLANVFAGMQLAFTDALRVGDLIVFEENSGSVEEITLTYVVVRTWDDRRWVVPSTYFTSKAFENWTRRESQMLGTVEFDLDWLVPIDAMRVELTRLLHASDLWDGRSNALQVTDSTGSHVRLRAVVSAATSGDVWDLRCYVREELINWLQRNAVYALPRTRLEPETTAAPTFEEREDFVEKTVAQWEAEQAVEATAVMPKSQPTDDDEEPDSGLPRWLHAWLGQRREGAEAAPARETRSETTTTSQSPEARLYSGSPAAEERRRTMSGPSAADMAEREQAAERRQRTGEQPAVDD